MDRLMISEIIVSDAELAKRKRKSDYNAKYYAKIENKLRISKNGAKYYTTRWSDPDIKLKLLERCAKYRSQPEIKIKIAVAAASRWLDPEYRRRAITIASKRRATPEGRSKDQEYKRQRRITNPSYKLTERLRNSLYLALKSNSKTSSALTLLGCSIDDLKSKLEGMFAFGMDWSNHGLAGWHLDHILPLASFDMSDPAQQKIAFHHTNLQPLWAKDNMKKGCNVETKGTK